MRKLKNIIFGILLTSAAFGAWNIWPTASQFFEVPPAKTTIDMTWHRWEQDNTTVLSTNEYRGTQIIQHLDEVRSKWAPAETPDAHIRLTIVDDQKTLNDLFGLDKSHVEVRSGEVCIWFLWDEDSDLGL